VNPGLTRPQRNLALWQAFITFCMTITAGASLTGVVGDKVAGLLTLGSAALNAATTTYLVAVKPPDTVAGQRDAAA